MGLHVFQYSVDREHRARSRYVGTPQSVGELLDECPHLRSSRAWNVFLTEGVRERLRWGPSQLAEQRETEMATIPVIDPASDLAVVIDVNSSENENFGAEEFGTVSHDDDRTAVVAKDCGRVGDAVTPVGHELGKDAMQGLPGRDPPERRIGIDELVAREEFHRRLDVVARFGLEIVGEESTDGR